MKRVGVLGGMGPEATVDFVRTVIRLTPATRDQDHIPMLIHHNPAIPDRTAHLLGTGPSPLSTLREMLWCLEKAGADFLVMPCNTAHSYFDELQASTRLPMLNMIELTAREAAAHFPNGELLVLMATNGTQRTGLYQDAFAKAPGAPPLMVPDGPVQELIQQAIYDVKAGRMDTARAALAQALHRLPESVAGVILGCTELPLIYPPGTAKTAETGGAACSCGPDPGAVSRPLPAINATECLAKATVRLALDGKGDGADPLAYRPCA